MGLFEHHYPYTDFHELNLDWFLNQFKTLVSDWENFHNTITSEWDATKNDWRDLYNYVHDYFDNLDVQKEIDNKLDKYVEDGTLSAIVNKMVNAKFYDVACIDIAGQVVDPNGRIDVQTFCSDSEYVYVFCTKNENDTTNTYLFKFSKTTGVLLNKFFISEGHIGSCGLMNNKIVCALDGNILILNKDGSVENTITLRIKNPNCTCSEECHCNCELCECSEDNCYMTISIVECTSDGNHIYAVDGENPTNLYKLNANGELIRKTTLTAKRNVIMQSLKIINNNLYMCVFDNSLRLYVISVYTLEGTFITNISIPIKTELEDVCVINGDTHILVNNYGTGTLYKITLEKFPLNTNYVSTHNQIKMLSHANVDHYYFNASSENLWNNGKSSDKPLRRLQNTYNLFNDYQFRLDIELLSDFDEGLVIRSCLTSFKIIGNSHQMQGLYINNNTIFEADHVTFNGGQFANDDGVYITGGKAEFKTCTFICTTQQNMLETIGCEVSLVNCTFEGETPSGQNIRALSGQYEMYDGLTISNYHDVILRDGVSILFNLSDTSWLNQNINLVNCPILGTTLKISELKANGTYRIQSNTTDTEYNLPGISAGGFITACTRANLTNLNIYTLSPNYIYNIIIGGGNEVVRQISSTQIPTS